LTGQVAEDVIRSRLWEPLGITTAGFGPSPESSMKSTDNPWPHIGNGPLGKDGLPTTEVKVSEPLLKKLHEASPETVENSYTYGGWLRTDSQSGEGYSLQHDGSNTMNYATAFISVTEARAAVVVTNVGGAEISSDANWVTGTHSVRDDLMAGKVVM
jgi:CubicO group peptidase (beta-lactamase class C family)